MRLISGTLPFTALPWLQVLANTEPPALHIKAATDKLVEKIIAHNNNNNNNGFICIAARMLDYTIPAMQDSAYNITPIII